MKIIIQRYNPETDRVPYDELFEIDDAQIQHDTMLLEVLLMLRENDSTLAFRSSCQEGVCGSDGMNVNGKNHLSCITPVSSLTQPITIRPLPGLPIIRDLIIDLNLFYQQYQSVKPYLQSEPLDSEHEHLQTPEQRAQLDGSYECILCACCSTSCPSFWWNPDQFAGPAALLAAQRFVIDSRDIKHIDRLQELDSPTKTFRCRHIQNCTDACPKGLNPSRAIQELKSIMVKELP
ncbi:succinate dehydrogenase iron-sulfur subunit [Thiomicrorhabdus sediminis]|uniref:Succinate dehydrogenase iron-sulfur subunit n=1 Tax=Thiomicrorhabdus sediminis TaxID=2580412 RepID=A0A4P9K752_9GAMM|nr:succinate dehydrogenase iron-sulfur subunit [Thiomicrorhabdus sediminis]QCU90290.1 succinate dehydrogenase iron-sulfur subunit [Thiomicrorhabdus sediminis]